MTLSEIETILQELSARHQNLNEELLTTLLVSAGWEEKTIKEAVVLFKQKEGSFKPKNTGSPPQESAQKGSLPQVNTVTEAQLTPPQTPSEITFYQPDGTEEGKLHAFVDVPVVNNQVVRATPASVVPVVKESVSGDQPKPSDLLVRPVEVEQPLLTEKKPENVIHPVVEPTVLPAPVIPTKVNVVPQAPPMTEPQSLIEHEEAVQMKGPEKQVPLPGNLPLLPFESSPHVWSFSKYKDVFHSDAPVHEEIKVITVMPEETSVKQVVQVPQKVTVYPEITKDEGVIIESVPLRKDDKPLVFLATIMLFAIILILGYMYSNGRL